MIRTAVSCSLVALALVAPTSAEAEEWYSYSMTVRRFDYNGPPGPYVPTSVTFTNANADSALTAASSVLQEDGDGSGSLDRVCRVSFGRSGNVGVFNTTDGNINAQGEMTTATSVSAFWKVVHTITWCQTTGVYYGCTIVGGFNGGVVVRDVSVGSLRGHLWAHEFGHSVGLNHIFEFRRLMMGHAEENTFVSESECTAMRSSSVDPNGPNNLVPFERNAGHVEVASDRRRSIEEISRAPIIDHVPMHLAGVYGQGDVAVLRGLLTTALEPVHRGTITSLIAILSDGSDVDADTLIAIARTEGDSMTVTASAIIGLGYLANRGSRRALDFLIAEAGGQGVRAEWAVQGLGVSGAPGVERVLERLAKHFPASTEVVDQALADHAFVRLYGLRAYYER
jgi:hypothetical protein